MTSDIGELRRARVLMDDMFARVAPDGLYDRPIPPRHRIVFYIGHVEAFDRNLLDVPSFAPELDRLFAFGIDPPSGQLPSDTAEDWPEIATVREYRDLVREKVDAAWEAVPKQKRHVAIEHRLMHAETLAYMLHGMAPSRLIPAGRIVLDDAPSPEHQMLPVSAGEVCLGQPDANEFGWDNEFSAYRQSVPAFYIDRYPVTNGDWLRFMEAGGPVPHFWRCTGNEWSLRTMFREVPLPLSWPVYVTYQQASSYAAWRKAGLPSEAQWHRAAYGDTPCRYPWGNAIQPGRHGNFDSYRFDPAPVTMHRDSASPYGIEDLLGNGWEWTSTPFRPFPGFQPFPFYRGYSADFFDDDHYVLKGGSPRTDARFLRRSFRNWFRRDYPYMYATFRCIRHT